MGDPLVAGGVAQAQALAGKISLPMGSRLVDNYVDSHDIVLVYSAPNNAVLDLNLPKGFQRDRALEAAFKDDVIWGLRRTWLGPSEDRNRTCAVYLELATSSTAYETIPDPDVAKEEIDPNAQLARAKISCAFAA